MLEFRIQMAIERFLAAQPFYPCCLLVHLDVVRLRQVALQVAGQYAWPVLPVGALLSAALLPIDARRRPAMAQPVLERAVEQHEAGPIICSEIDILFEPSLSLDPLRLLRETSRLRSLIVAWPGAFRHGALEYATADPAHAHHRAWAKPELCEECIVTI